ncbi:MAG: hypothetical protein LCH85_02280 [Chloroflexi bacterium]|nr:hypothetical protein [Chloroflexota bacterium]
MVQPWVTFNANSAWLWYNRAVILEIEAHYMGRRVASWVWVLGLYSILAIGLTWPLITVWDSQIPGQAHKDGLEDAYQNIWNLWWMRQAISQPTNPLITDRFFHPETPNLYYHTLSPINTLLATPITAIWGPIAGFNSLVLLSFIVGAFGAWKLAYDRVGSAWLALPAGVIFAWNPFHVASVVEDGQLQIFCLQWIPFYLLYAWRLAERGDRRSLGLAGLFLGLTIWTDWYFSLFLLLWTLGFGLWQFWRSEWPQRKRLFIQFGLLGIIGMLTALPLLVPMLIEASRADYMQLYPENDPVRLSADLAAFVVPARLHSLWGRFFSDLPSAINRRLYLGVVPLGLAIVATWKTAKARPWLIMTLILAILALGPTLKLAGTTTTIPLPYRLIQQLPFISLARQPDRFMVLGMLTLAIASSYGLVWLSSKLAWQRSLALVIVVIIGIEYLPTPFDMRQPPMPPSLAQLPKTDDAALLELPFHEDLPYRDAERMLFQTVHGRPISGGYHSRLYPQPQYQMPVLRDLATLSQHPEIVQTAGDWQQQLATLNFGYIVGYKQQPNGPRNYSLAQIAEFKQFVEANLGVTQPLAEDDFMVIYQVPQAQGVPIINLRDGWGNLEPSTTGNYRWMGQVASLGLIVPEAGFYRLRWQATPAATARTLQLSWHNNQLSIPISLEPRQYEVLIELPAGQTIVQLQALEPATTGDAIANNGDQRPISLQFSNMQLISTQ